MLPKVEGGLNLPDIRGYNIACLLRHVLDWIKGTNQFSSCSLEADLASPWHLMALLHTKWAHLPKLVRSSVLLRDTIVTWKELRKILGLPFCVSKLMPLWGHPEFGVGVGSNSGQALKQKGILTAQHLIHPDEGRWLRATEVIERYSLPATQFLAVAQIIHFCRARLLDLSREASINSFDEILNKSSQDHGISCLYALIRQHMAKCTPKQAFKKYSLGGGPLENILSTKRGERHSIK